MELKFSATKDRQAKITFCIVNAVFFFILTITQPWKMFRSSPVNFTNLDSTLEDLNKKIDHLDQEIVKKELEQEVINQKIDELEKKQPSPGDDENYKKLLLENEKVKAELRKLTQEREQTEQKRKETEEFIRKQLEDSKDESLVENLGKKASERRRQKEKELQFLMENEPKTYTVEKVKENLTNTIERLKEQENLYQENFTQPLIDAFTKKEVLDDTISTFRSKGLLTDTEKKQLEFLSSQSENQNRVIENLLARGGNLFLDQFRSQYEKLKTENALLNQKQQDARQLAVVNGTSPELNRQIDRDQRQLLKNQFRIERLQRQEKLIRQRQVPTVAPSPGATIPLPAPTPTSYKPPSQIAIRLWENIDLSDKLREIFLRHEQEAQTQALQLAIRKRKLEEEAQQSEKNVRDQKLLEVEKVERELQKLNFKKQLTEKRRKLVENYLANTKEVYVNYPTDQMYRSKNIQGPSLTSLFPFDQSLVTTKPPPSNQTAPMTPVTQQPPPFFGPANLPPLFGPKNVSPVFGPEGPSASVVDYMQATQNQKILLQVLEQAIEEEQIRLAIKAQESKEREQRLKKEKEEQEQLRNLQRIQQAEIQIQNEKMNLIRIEAEAKRKNVDRLRAMEEVEKMNKILENFQKRIEGANLDRKIVSSVVPLKLVDFNATTPWYKHPFFEPTSPYPKTTFVLPPLIKKIFEVVAYITILIIVIQIGYYRTSFPTFAGESNIFLLSMLAFLYFMIYLWRTKYADTIPSEAETDTPETIMDWTKLISSLFLIVALFGISMSTVGTLFGMVPELTIENLSILIVVATIFASIFGILIIGRDFYAVTRLEKSSIQALTNLGKKLESFKWLSLQLDYWKRVETFDLSKVNAFQSGVLTNLVPAFHAVEERIKQLPDQWTLRKKALSVINQVLPQLETLFAKVTNETGFQPEVFRVTEDWIGIYDRINTRLAKLGKPDLYAYWTSFTGFFGSMNAPPEMITVYTGLQLLMDSLFSNKPLATRQESLAKSKEALAESNTTLSLLEELEKPPSPPSFWTKLTLNWKERVLNPKILGYLCLLFVFWKFVELQPQNIEAFLVQIAKGLLTLGFLLLIIFAYAWLNLRKFQQGGYQPKLDIYEWFDNLLQQMKKEKLITINPKELEMDLVIERSVPAQFEFLMTRTKEAFQSMKNRSENVGFNPFKIIDLNDELNRETLPFIEKLQNLYSPKILKQWQWILQRLEVVLSKKEKPSLFSYYNGFIDIIIEERFDIGLTALVVNAVTGLQSLFYLKMDQRQQEEDLLSLDERLKSLELELGIQPISFPSSTVKKEWYNFFSEHKLLSFVIIGVLIFLLMTWAVGGFTDKAEVEETEPPQGEQQPQRELPPTIEQPELEGKYEELINDLQNQLQTLQAQPVRRKVSFEKMETDLKKQIAQLQGQVQTLRTQRFQPFASVAPQPFASVAPQAFIMGAPKAQDQYFKNLPSDIETIYARKPRIQFMSRRGSAPDPSIQKALIEPQVPPAPRAPPILTEEQYKRKKELEKQQKALLKQAQEEYAKYQKEQKVLEVAKTGKGFGGQVRSELFEKLASRRQEAAEKEITYGDQ